MGFISNLFILLCIFIHAAFLLVTDLASIRKIVRDHDERLNRATVLSSSQKKRIKEGGKIYADFQSIHLIGFHRDESNETEEMDVFERPPVKILNSLESHNDDLHQPISLQMILDFIQLNRHFFEQPMDGVYSFNYEYDGKSPDDFPPLGIEKYSISLMNADAIIYEFDDEDAEVELLYSIIINR